MKAWFNDLTMGRKISLLMLSALLMVGAVGTVAYRQIASIYANTQQLSTVRLPGTNLLLQLDRDMQQALVAERTLLQTTPGSKEFNALSAEYSKNIGQVVERWDKYAALPKTDREKALIAPFVRSRDRWIDLSDRVLRQAASPSLFERKQAAVTSVGACGQAFEEARDVIDQLTGIVEAEAEHEITSADATMAEAVYALLLWSVAGLSVIIGIGIAVTKAVVRPLHAMHRQMLDADLHSRFNATRADEIGELQRAFDGFAGKIMGVLLQVSEASAAVASASTEISSSTEQLAAGSQEQSSQASEAAAAVEQMNIALGDTTRKVLKVSENAREARTSAERGGDVVAKTVSGMKRIAEVVNHTAGQVKVLGSSSEKIGEIISVIDEIADQTNLLALNAAIEAARAGEQGRGFAVVADEVRKLAERTSNATKEIASMIRQIQTDTAMAVGSMKEGTQEVASGIGLAERAGTMLLDIVANAQTVADMVDEVAAASQRQSMTSSQVTRNVDGISSIAQQSASSTHQIARTAEDLNRMTEGLQQLLDSFGMGREPARTGTGGNPVRRVHRTNTAVREPAPLVSA